MGVSFSIQLRSSTLEERKLWESRLPAWKAITQNHEKILTLGDPARMAWIIENGVVWIWAESEETLYNLDAHLAFAVIAPRPLIFWGWLEKDTSLDKTLASSGWREEGEQTLYEMELEKMRLTKVDRLTSIYTKKENFPTDVSISPLNSETDTSEILSFIFRVMPNSRLPVMDRLRAGGVEGFSSHISHVLRTNSEVRGVILCTWKGEVAEADLVVVDRDLRGGWANLLLKQSVVSPMQSMGVKFVRYWVNPALNADAIKAALLAKAKIVQRLHTRKLI